MKLHLKSTLLIGFVFFGVQLKAQNSLTIATDPLSIPALNGFEVEAGFNFKQHRIALSYLQGNLPPWYGQAADFKSTSHSTVEIAFSRFIKPEPKGFSYGLSYAYFTEFAIENEIGQSLEKNPSRIALKLAYAWFPFEKIGLYVEPSMTFGLLVGDEDLVFSSGEIFEKKTLIGNGPLLNIGYRLSLSRK